jgi:flagellar biosynthetic protein FlhB
MADQDMGEKTEEPTPRRRQEARDEGNVAMSTDLTAALALTAGLLLLRGLGPHMLETMYALTRGIGEAPAVRPEDLLPWIRRVARAAAEIVFPFLVLLALITAASIVAQTGLLVTWKKLNPKPERLNPIEGFKRIFSSQALARLVFGVFKIAVLAAISYFSISGQIGYVLGTGALHTQGIYVVSANMLFELALKLAVALLLLGVADYFFQRWTHERKLRMTKQEVRDELKKMEGDPLIKQRRRRMQAQIALQRLQTDVPRADVVVTNPTHYAVALKYDQQTMAAPRVLAKGKDLVATRIRQIAAQHRVPIVQRPPLARGLYASVEIGQEVPPQFYRAIAEVLAYVYQITGRAAG